MYKKSRSKSVRVVILSQQNSRARDLIKIMLDLAKPEILHANKYKNIKKVSFLQAQMSLECYFTANKCYSGFTITFLQSSFELRSSLFV